MTPERGTVIAATIATVDPMGNRGHLVGCGFLILIGARAVLIEGPSLLNPKQLQIRRSWRVQPPLCCSDHIYRVRNVAD